jgi:hypothetical protein
MPLFEVAIIEKPTRKEAEDGAAEKLIVAPKAVIARDERAAAINAIMELTTPPTSTNRDRWEVLVRPFA